MSNESNSILLVCQSDLPYPAPVGRWKRTLKHYYQLVWTHPRDAADDMHVERPQSAVNWQYLAADVDAVPRASNVCLVAQSASDADAWVSENRPSRINCWRASSWTGTMIAQRRLSTRLSMIYDVV
jgi:hypothetical protein